MYVDIYIYIYIYTTPLDLKNLNQNNYDKENVALTISKSVLKKRDKMII